MSTREKRLRKARKQRIKASQMLSELEKGNVTLVDILNDVPKALLRVRIFTVMCRAPHLGEAGVKKCLVASKVWPEDRMGNLSEEQRSRIVKHLPARAK